MEVPKVVRENGTLPSDIRANDPDWEELWKCPEGCAVAHRYY